MGLFGKKKKENEKPKVTRKTIYNDPQYYKDAYDEYVKLVKTYKNDDYNESENKMISFYQFYGINKYGEPEEGYFDKRAKETPEVYEARLELAEKIEQYWLRVCETNDDDYFELSVLEKMGMGLYQQKQRVVYEKEFLSDEDYEHVRKGIKDFYTAYKGDNYCIISPYYVIDAWLTIAQSVYYDNPERKLSDDLKAFNYYLPDLLKKIKTGNIDYNNNNGFKECFNPYSQFDFKVLDPEDNKYKEYIEKYVQENYGYDFRKFDATFSLGTAKMILNDVINNGVCPDFITYDIQERELMDILNIRDTRKITKEQFFNLSDYGKELTIKEAIRNDIGIMIFPEQVRFYDDKLQKDLLSISRSMIAKEYGKSGYELNKGISSDDKVFHTGSQPNIQVYTNIKDEWIYEVNRDAGDNVSKHYKGSSRNFENYYPVYYYDKENKVKVLNTFYHIKPSNNINNYIKDGKIDVSAVNYDLNIVSLAELENKFLDSKIKVVIACNYKQDENTKAITINNKEFMNKQELADYNSELMKAGTALGTKYDNDLKTGKVPFAYYKDADPEGHNRPFWFSSKTINVSVRDCFSKLSLPFSLSKYIDYSNIYEGAVKFKNLNKDNIKTKDEINYTER